jgi:hypothetical protein
MDNKRDVMAQFWWTLKARELGVGTGVTYDKGLWLKLIELQCEVILNT